MQQPPNKTKITSLIVLSAFFLLFFNSCTCRPHTQSYREQYRHLKGYNCQIAPMQETDYFIVFLVHARHLDYSHNLGLLRTLVKHPDDCSKTGDVGHAWIYLQGYCDGNEVVLEGGHSGELGIFQPKYFDGIMNYLDYGVANPYKGCMRYRYESDPVKYLWETQKDGYFEAGSGSHFPTYAVKINLTPNQFEAILHFIQNYNFSEYRLMDHQCSTFVTEIASIAGINLDHQITIDIAPQIVFRGRCIRLWENPKYEHFTFSSPDIIEKSLIELVRDGRAEYALEWYKKK